MTVELTGEQEELVLRLAEQTGKSPAELIAEMLTQMDWVEDAEERGLIHARIAEADSDETQWISHEEVGRRMGLI